MFRRYHLNPFSYCPDLDMSSHGPERARYTKVFFQMRLLEGRVGYGSVVLLNDMSTTRTAPQPSRL